MDIEAAAASSISPDDNTGKPTRVRWIDSGLAANGWRTLDEVPSDVSKAESIGIWIGENDRVVAIAGTRDAENENWLNVQLIYKPCIELVEWLQ